MQLMNLTIDRKQWGKDEGKLVGEITFKGQEAKVTILMDEAKCHRMLEIVAENVVEQGRAVGALLVSQIGRPTAEIEPSPEDSGTF